MVKHSPSTREALRAIFSTSKQNKSHISTNLMKIRFFPWLTDSPGILNTRKWVKLENDDGDKVEVRSSSLHNERMFTVYINGNSGQIVRLFIVS